MKKNLFFKFFIFAVIATFVTVTSCKDYNDDISRIDGDIAALKTELTAAKTQADNAATAAATAQTAANQALAAAQAAAAAIPSEANIQALARAQADAAIAAAGLQNATQVQALINAAIADIDAGLTEDDLDDFYTDRIQPIVDALNTEIAGLKASDTAIALNQLKLQALVFSQFGIDPADYEVLTETIAQLEAGEITAAEIDWDAINDLIASIEDGRLKISGKTLSTLVFEPMVWTDGGGRAMLFHHHQYLPLTATGKQYIQKTNAAANWVKRTETPIVNYAMNSKLIAESSFLKDNIYFGYKEVATRHGLVAAPKATYMGMQNGNMQVKVTAPAELFWHGRIGDMPHYHNNATLEPEMLPDSLDIVQLNVPLAGSDDIVSSDWAILYAKYMPEVHIAFNGPANTKYNKIGVDGYNTTKTNYFYTIDYFEATDHNINGTVGTSNRVHQWEPDVLLPFESSLDLLTVVKAAAASAQNTAAANMATAANLTGPFPRALTNNYHEWTSTDWSTAFEMERLGYTWKFDIVPYTIGTTKQEDFIAIDGTVVTSKTFDETGTAAIGRTPVIRASIMNGNNIVATAFIKLEIIRPIEPGLERELDFGGDKYFTCSTGISNDVTVQWMNLQIYNPLKLSKAQFHNAYSLVSHNGQAGYIGDVVEAANPSQENTRILTWMIPADSAWVHQGKTISRVVEYTRGDGTAGPVIITFKVDIPKFAPEINTKDIYTSFWTDDKVYFKQNTAVPTGTSGSAISADENTFVNNVYAGFLNYTGATQQKGLLNWSSIATDYEDFQDLYDQLTVHYVFADTPENNRSITVNGVTYIVEVADDGSSLTAKVGSNGTKQTIAKLAKIPNYVGGRTSAWEYKLQYYGHKGLNQSQRSEYAQILLNNPDSPFTARIKTLAYACGDTDKSVTVGGDKAEFDVQFLRPVYAEKGNGYWIDAADTGSKVKVLDAFSLHDWRPNYFEPNNQHLYTFYGITLRNIMIDTTNATIERADGTGTVQALQGGNVTVERNNNRDRIYFVYRNTGNPVSADYIIKFRATLEYNWGTLTIPVEIDLHPSDWTPAP